MSNYPPNPTGPQPSGGPYEADATHLSDRGQPSAASWGSANSYAGNPTQPLPPYSGENPTQPLPPYSSDPAATQQLPPYQSGGYGQPNYGNQNPGYGQPAAFGGQGSYPPGGPGSYPPGGPAQPPPGGKKGGLPWWAWALIGVLVLGLIGGIVFAATNAMKPTEPSSSPSAAQPSTPTAGKSTSAPAPTAPTTAPTTAKSTAKPSASSSSSKSSPSASGSARPDPQSLADVDALAREAGVSCSQWDKDSVGDVEGQQCLAGKDMFFTELYSPTIPLNDAFWTSMASDANSTGATIYVVTDKNHWGAMTQLSRSSLDKMATKTKQKVYKVTDSGLVPA